MGMTFTNAEITEMRKHDLPGADDVKMYREYAEGRHNEVLSTEQQALLGERAEHAMVDNIVGLVLNTTASRLRLTRWDVQGSDPTSVDDGEDVSVVDAQDVRAYLNGLWLKNRLARLQAEVTYATLRDGNSAVALAWRGGRVHLTREPWWDGKTGVYIAYAEDGSYAYAVKEWVERLPDGSTRTRRTVYEPGMIYRYWQNGSGWDEFEDESVRPFEPWARDASTPLPIPLVHFANGGRVMDTPYGESDLQGLLALQDDLNATQRDISASTLMTAFQRIFLSGVAAVNKIKLRPGGVWGETNPNARLTVVESGDISQLTNVHAYKRQSIAIASRTPMHAITGDWPSGAALLRADMPQIDKVESLADAIGPQWTMVAHRATELANVYGAADLNEEVPIVSVFAPAERIDDLTKLQIDQARATYWETIARLPQEAMVQAGVSKDTAEAIVRQREAMFTVTADAGLEL